MKDFDDQYVSRWHNARNISKLSQLPMFADKDVISVHAGAQSQLSYEYHVLVIRRDALPKEQQTPVNMLWTPVMDGENARYAQNMITGVFSNLSQSDFVGILRPEFENKIDFDALKGEYTATHENTRQNMPGHNIADDMEDEQEDEY